MGSRLLADVASKILSESLRIRKGETVVIETWSTGFALAREVAKQARRAGAIPLVLFEDEGAYIESVRKGPREVLGSMGKHEYGMLSSTDAYVFIPGPPLGAYYKRVSREEYTNSIKYNSSWYDAAEKAKLRGVRLSFGYVGRDLAGYLRKRPEEVRRAQLKACLADLKEIGETGRAISRKMKDGTTAVVRTRGAELSFVLKGDVTVDNGAVDSSDIAGKGLANLPPGVVSKEVDGATASGTIALSPSLTRLGVAETLVLEFSGGRLVSWSSRRPATFIDELLRPLKEEKRTLTLLTVGLNGGLSYGFGVDRYVAGSVSVGGFGFVGIAREATLRVGGLDIVKQGRL